MANNVLLDIHHMLQGVPEEWVVDVNDDRVANERGPGGEEGGSENDLNQDEAPDLDQGREPPEGGNPEEQEGKPGSESSSDTDSEENTRDKKGEGEGVNQGLGLEESESAEENVVAEDTAEPGRDIDEENLDSLAPPDMAQNRESGESEPEPEQHTVEPEDSRGVDDQEPEVTVAPSNTNQTEELNMEEPLAPRVDTATPFPGAAVNQ